MAYGLGKNIIFNKVQFSSVQFKKKKFRFFSTFQKITVGGFVNQLIKKLWPKYQNKRNNFNNSFPTSVVC